MPLGQRQLFIYWRVASSDLPVALNALRVASQLLQRPGLAQTQAVLARELSGGSDEASQLFRQTTNIGRAIERLRGSILEMQTGAQLAPDAAALLAELLQGRVVLELVGEKTQGQRIEGVFARIGGSNTLAGVVQLGTNATLAFGPGDHRLAALEDRVLHGRHRHEPAQ